MFSHVNKLDIAGRRASLSTYSPWATNCISFGVEKQHNGGIGGCVSKKLHKQAESYAFRYTDSSESE